jgi:hypothetical protein
MAAAQKVSPATVQRIWKKHKLQRHRVESLKFSTDPQFARKVRDIVGPYLNPPDKAIVQPDSGASRSCRCVPACPRAKRTITNATERPRYSLP